MTSQTDAEDEDGSHAAEPSAGQGAEVPRGSEVDPTQTELEANGANGSIENGTSLRKRALQGSAWVLGGLVASHALRLANNLVLTRLLIPEAFGLMGIVQVILQGLNMFSEVGIRSSIIADDRGDDRDFVNTAWTIQIIRGVVIFAAAWVLTAPAAGFYAAPELHQILPFVAIAALIDGLGSTARFTLIRRVEPARPIQFDLIAQITSLVLMVTLAWFWRSVWVLAIGYLTTALIKNSLSHLMIPGYSNRPRWDRQAAGRIVRFGGWIYLSAVFAFLASQGDRLVLAKVLGVEGFGVFGVALYVAQAALQALEALSANILHPVYKHLLDRPLPQTRKNIFEARRMLLCAMLPPVCFIAIFGGWIIEVLYDDRYLEAGWMLRILAVGTIGQVVAGSAERVILAGGNSFRWMSLQLSRFSLLGIALWIGYTRNDPALLLWGCAIARLVGYIPLALFLRLQGVWLPKLDASALALALGTTFLGIWLVG